MIRLFSCCTLLLVLLKPSVGQNNLFDCENSRKFANYLFNTNQFENARHELERIRFFCEFDSVSQLTLLKTYRKLKLFDSANDYYNNISFNDLTKLNPDLKLEYIRLQMTQKRYSNVQKAIKQGLTFKDEKEHLLATELLMGNWNAATQLAIQFNGFENLKLNALKNVAERSETVKRKKIWLATIMSMVIPGSGKMYSGYWGDGVLSFLFTTSSTYFAFRAFDKNGTKKIYPWLAGGLAFSYYSANIYGGNRAAFKYNNDLKHGFIHETEQIIYSDY
jgi:TM2 domain-containing membrane protein YozV